MRHLQPRVFVTRRRPNFIFPFFQFSSSSTGLLQVSHQGQGELPDVRGSRSNPVFHSALDHVEGKMIFSAAVKMQNTISFVAIQVSTFLKTVRMQN